MRAAQQKQAAARALVDAVRAARRVGLVVVLDYESAEDIATAAVASLEGVEPLANGVEPIDALAGELRNARLRDVVRWTSTS